MKKKIIVIILAILVAITIGVIAYNILNKPEKEINEEVKIPNSDFKLNDVLNKFLETKYAHDNKCTGSIKDNGLQIQCNKQEFIYKLDNVELFTNTSKEGFDVFKNLVIVIETLNGYKENEYEETINKVINNELYVNGIKYQNINNEIYLSIVINEKLDKYEAKEVIDKEVVKDIKDVNYEYKSGGYLINNIRIANDEEDKIYVISAYFSGKDFNKTVKIKYYDSNKNVIKIDEAKLNDYNNYGNKYLIFTKTTKLNELFNQVSYYSINLE